MTLQDVDFEEEEKIGSTIVQWGEKEGLLVGKVVYGGTGEDKRQILRNAQAAIEGAAKDLKAYLSE